MSPTYNGRSLAEMSKEEVVYLFERMVEKYRADLDDFSERFATAQEVIADLRQQLESIRIATRIQLNPNHRR